MDNYDQLLEKSKELREALTSYINSEDIYICGRIQDLSNHEISLIKLYDHLNEFINY